MVIRTCVLEDMNNQCGTFKFGNETYKGCILTCDFDGCNAAVSLKFSFLAFAVSLMVLMQGVIV